MPLLYGDDRRKEKSPYHRRFPWNHRFISSRLEMFLSRETLQEIEREQEIIHLCEYRKEMFIETSRTQETTQMIEILQEQIFIIKHE